jgi:hypothetical protein
VGDCHSEEYTKDQQPLPKNVYYSMAAVPHKFHLNAASGKLLLRKTMKNLSHDILSLGQDLNSGSPEYKAGKSTSCL